MKNLILLFLCFVLLSFFSNAQKKDNTKSTFSSTYSTADVGHYMKKWWLLGPLPIKTDTAANLDMNVQNKFFDEDQISVTGINPAVAVPGSFSGKELHWMSYTSKKDVIDLDSIYKKDYAAAYAWAEVTSESDHLAFLAVSSDDAIKVWHNGKLVHNNWITRGLTPDQDIISIALTKGSNQILIKVQDVTQGWGFTARFLDKPLLSDRLITAAGRGNLDEIDLLLKAGASLEKTNSSGLTPLDAARLQGRDEVVKLLLTKGAKEHPFPAPEKLIDGLYDNRVGKEVPGVAVLVSKDGQVVYKKGFGYADIEKKEKISPDTKFRIGSITKQFTAAAVLKLQEENRLSVTDKLSKYFPDFPRGEEVTLHHLLTHTSGIHSFTNKSDFIEKVTAPITNENLLLYFKNDPYDFNPGEEYRYSNSGYFLLGYIVEKASGKSYGQYLKDAFFDPLQMSNTGVHSSTLTLKNEATGYSKSNGKYEKAANWDMSWAGGAGALYSTVEDLYKWNEALFHGKVISNKSLETAITSVRLNNGKTPPDGEYGYGLMPGRYRDLITVQHGGGLLGFISQLTRFPKENLTVAILTNQTPPEVNLNANIIAEFYLWDKMAKQSSYSSQSASNQDLKVYEGRYDFHNSMVMIVTLEENQLFAQLTGQPKFPIFPSASGEFFWKVVDAKIKFFKNANGEVTHGHFSQGGNEFDVAKLKDEVVVAVDSSIVKTYVGKYDLGNNFIVTITNDSNKVFAQGTNQPRFEILPVSEKEFMAKEVNVRITFVQDANNRVTKLILDQGGVKKDAPRIE